MNTIMKYSEFSNYFYTGVIFLFYILNHCAFSVSSNKNPSPAKLELTSNLDTLQLVQVIFRHGDRAPIHPYPNDPFKNQSLYWPEGWTELTKVGLKQQLELGQYLRKRYDGFLPRKYSHFDFVALSSDVDRAIQSAEANLAGLYKLQMITPSGDMTWQAVPIHTIPEATDIWINDKAICPKYIEMLGSVYSSAELGQLDAEYSEFIQFISEKSGVIGISKLTEIFQVQDALRCEHFHNMSLPLWASDEVRSKLDYIKALSFKWKLQTKEMKRLRAGPMVGKLLQNFKTRSALPEGFIPDDSPFQDERPFRKMHFFAGHDSTLAGVLSVWDIFDTHIPPYASALMMELHKNPGDLESHIQIYYRNETSREPYNLLIPGCESPCFLSKLEEISTDFIPYDWDQECLSQSQTQILQGAAPADADSPISAQQLGMSYSGLYGLAGAIGIVSSIAGAALLTNAYLKRVKIINPPVGLGANNYETFS